MKKLIILTLTFVMAASLLTGCGSKNKEESKNPETPPVEDQPNTNPPENPADNAISGDNNNMDMNGMMLTEGTKLDDIVMKLGEDLGITMPEKLDDKTIVDVMGLNSDDIEEYYGEYAIVNTSADNIIAVKAKEGKVDSVKKALEARKDSVVKNFEQYLPEQLDKAKAGKVIQKGNYVFLVIAGDMEKGAEQEIKRAEEIIDTYFSK